MSALEIEVKGIDKIMAGFRKFPEEIKNSMRGAAEESGHEIIQTKGLKIYPPETDANKPPTPYYIRGRGMQNKSGNNMKSEKYGARFYVKQEGYGAIIGNSASYAKYLADEEEQATHMEKIGWRKLIDVAREKLDKVKDIYERWAQYTINKLGL